MDYLSPVAGLLGVVIGGWLSPWITARMENRKVKKTLKPQLIRYTHQFFQLRKHYIQTLNIHNFEMRKSQIFFNASISPKWSPEQKAEFKGVHDAINKESAIGKVYQYFEGVTECESQLMALIAQTNEYYGKKVYEELSDLLKPHLDNSNQNSNIHVYDNLTPAEIDAMNPTFRDNIMKKGQEFDPICQSVIEKIMNIVK